jgi:hypothetical protein
MSIAEQALFLLDILPSIAYRKKPENFDSLDPVINASFRGDPEPAAESAENTANLYTVASRMGRSNYDEHAKAEALLHALRQMRAKNAKRPANASRVLRRP